jgi:hypothetical protein
MLIHYTLNEEIAFKYINQIESVIKKLPKKNQKQIHNHCIILLLEETYGYFIKEPKKCLIIFNIYLFEKDKLTNKDQQLIIAHEFAHFILNHGGLTKKEEDEANSLVKEWGFE